MLPGSRLLVRTWCVALSNKPKLTTTGLESIFRPVSYSAYSYSAYSPSGPSWLRAENGNLTDKRPDSHSTPDRPINITARIFYLPNSISKPPQFDAVTSKPENVTTPKPLDWEKLPKNKP